MNHYVEFIFFDQLPISIASYITSLRNLNVLNEAPGKRLGEMYPRGARPPLDSLESKPGQMNQHSPAFGGRIIPVWT